jgi:hypothetical protein
LRVLGVGGSVDVERQCPDDAAAHCTPQRKLDRVGPCPNECRTKIIEGNFGIPTRAGCRLDDDFAIAAGLIRDHAEDLSDICDADLIMVDNGLGPHADRRSYHRSSCTTDDQRSLSDQGNPASWRPGVVYKAVAILAMHLSILLLTRVILYDESAPTSPGLRLY